MADNAPLINVREMRRGQSRMDNSETLATLGTQDTGIKQNHTIQHRKLKR